MLNAKKIYLTKQKLNCLQMFKGNVGADSIKYNVFEVPIIAQWVRINPTRWRDRISLRAELYGCEYGEMRKKACNNDVYFVNAISEILSFQFPMCCISMVPVWRD